MPAASSTGNGEKNFKGRPKVSERTLAGSAMRSTVWGPKTLVSRYNRGLRADEMGSRLDCLHRGYDEE